MRASALVSALSLAIATSLLASQRGGAPDSCRGSAGVSATGGDAGVTPAGAEVTSNLRRMCARVEPPPIAGHPTSVVVLAEDAETRVSVHGVATIAGLTDTIRVATGTRFTHTFRCTVPRTGTRAVCDRVTVRATGYVEGIANWAGGVHEPP